MRTPIYVFVKKLIISIILFLISIVLYPQESDANMIRINKDIELQKIKDSFFVHTTYFDSEEFGRFPSNGMLIIKNGKALMIDTPMNIKMTEEIYEYLQSALNVEITKIIVGHYHDDCLGGLAYLHEKGIESISLDLTRQKCKEYDLPIAKIEFSDKLSFDFEGIEVLVQYFGGGHTADNIVVYFPSKKILFGGCLIKSMASKGLGNTADAVISEWKPAIQKLIDEFPDVETVVPGHGQYGGTELLIHTMNLVSDYYLE